MSNIHIKKLLMLGYLQCIWLFNGNFFNDISMLQRFTTNASEDNYVNAELALTEREK